MSVDRIIQLLANRGTPSPTGKAHWSKQALESILTREKYTGSSTILGEHRIENYHLASIPSDCFESVQNKRAKRSNVELTDEGRSGSL